MTDKAWKATERKIAGLLGGERIPVSGRQRGDSPDIKHEWLSLEIKHKKKLPDWIHDAMDQAQASKKGEQLPMVVFHQNRTSNENDYCVIRLGDFIDYFGALSEEREELL